MGELVSLDAYRKAKKALADRAMVRKWGGLRFHQIADWDLFIFPPELDRTGQIYLKSDNVADPLGAAYFEEGPAVRGGTSDFPLPPDYPVIPLREE